MLLGVLFLDTSGIRTIPLVIVAVAVSFVLPEWLTGPPGAPQAPGLPTWPLARQGG